MIKEIIASGKDINEARTLARDLLGVDELADVNYEIVDAGSKGIFGIIGVRPAKVRAYVELPDDTPRHEPPKENRQNRENGEKKSDRQPREQRSNGNREGGQRRQQNRDRKPRNEERIPKTNPNPQPPKKKSEVIPEGQVKLEKLEVAPGEDRSLDFVRTLIANLGMNAEATLYSASDGTRRIVVSGDDAANLIGHHGDTLDSLQYLANLACAQNNSKGERDHSRVTIDIEGYRAKREEALRAVARRMAEKAKRTHRNVSLEPMSPYERRIIHDEVSRIDGVTTSSIGSDNNRRVVIYFERDTQGSGNEVKEEAPVATEEVAVTETVTEETAANDSESEDNEIEIEVTEVPADETEADTASESDPE